MDWFKNILDRYGDDAIVFSGGTEKHTKAFVNPVISDRYLQKWKAMTDLGEVDQSTYYYFGSPECEISDPENSYVICNGKTYKFIRAELYRVEGEPSHWEAMLRIREEDYNG